MSGTVVLREATVEDAREIAEVHVAVWRRAYRDLLPAEFLDALSVDDRVRMWTEVLGSPQEGVFVTERDGRVVGFCGYGPSRDDDATASMGNVSTLYVLEEVSGRGVGSALVAAAETRLRQLGYERAALWVLAANERGRRFYERAGWRWDGTTGEFRIDCGYEPMVRYVREL